MDLSSLSDDELLSLYNNGGRPTTKSANSTLSKMSDAQLLAMYSRLNPAKLAEVPQEEKKPEEPGMFGRFGRGVARQTEGLLSSLETAYDTSIGGKTDEEAYKAAEERQKKIAERYPGGPSLDKVTEAYKQKGLGSAAGEVLYQVPEAVGSIIPTMAGGIVGGMVAGPPGAVVGMGATSGLTQYGSNLERQFEEQAKSGKPIQADKGAAAIAAAGQAGLDTVGFMIPFGKALISPFYKAAEKGGLAAAERLAAESISKTLAKGTAVGMLAEIPTEVAQQMIERYQAGLDLFSEDAIKEYGDIAYQTAISVAPLGAPARMIEKSGAKAEVAQAAANEEEKKRLAAEETQYVSQRQQEFAQADLARQQQEQAQAEEAAKAAGMGFQPKLEAPPERAEGPAPAPEERTRPELRGDNFVLVGEKSGNPVQGGFRTMEEAQAASDAFNQRIKEQEDQAAIEEKKVKDAQFVELANKIRNMGGTPIYLDEVPTGIAAKIHNARMARAGQPYILDQSAPFTTAQEINALELNEDRNLTVVKRGRDGRILLRSGGPKPDEMNLSDRLLQVQNPGIDVANGLTIPDEQKLAEQAKAKEQGRPVVMQGQRDNLAQTARDQQIAEERAAQDWQNSPVRPFSEAVDKQQDRVNKIAEELEKAKGKKVKKGLQKRLTKAQAQLEDAQAKLNEAKQKYGVTEGPYRPAEVIGQQKAAEQSKMKAALKTAFDRMGLTKQGVSPEVVSYLADAEGKPQRGANAVEAEYNPQAKTITFASDIYNPNLSVDEIVDRMMDVLNHEIIHSLKAAGLFTKPEWNILENFVKNGEGRRFLERAKVVYPDLSPSEQIEEAVAEAARAFKDGDFKPVGKPRSLFERIINFFKSIFSAAKENNTTPEAIFDAVRKGEIGNRKATQDATKARSMQAKVGEAGTRDWTNLEFMFRTLGRQMYNKDVGNITAKELIQNSFDAIKSAQAQGKLIGPGKIVYDYNNDDTSITVTDNGTGMDEDTIKSAFFTVFGTKKESLSPKDSSGGFGLAKLAYLLAAEDIKLESTKDGVTYSLQTNADEVMHFYKTRSDIELEKKNTPNKPNGTKVYIKLPKEVTNKDGEILKTNVNDPDILGYNWRKIIGNVEIYKRGPYNSDVKPELDKKITDLSEFRPPQTHKFSWGEVDLYIGKNMKKHSTQPIVLSSGIYQFDIWDVQSRDGQRPLVESIYNVKSYSTPAGLTMDEFEGKNTGAKNTGYPFKKDREGFEEFVMNDIKKLHQIVLNESKLFQIAEEVKSMSSFYKMSPEGQEVSGNFKFRSVSAPRTSSGINFEKIDVGVSDVDIENRNFEGKKDKFPSDSVYFHSNINKDLIEEAGKNKNFNKARAREFFYKLGRVFHDFAFKKMAAVSKLDPSYDAYNVGRNERIVGISIDTNYHGVNTTVPISGMFINPFPIHTKLQGRVGSIGIAAEWMRTMMHEVAHEVIKNHSAKFASEELMLYPLIRQSERNDKNLITLSQIEDSLENLYNEYKPEYEAMKDVYDKSDTKNLSESIGGDGERVAELEERTRERRRQLDRSNVEGSGRQEGRQVGEAGRQGSDRFAEENKGVSQNVTESGQIPRQSGRTDVKQSRVGPGTQVPPVWINLNTPQQNATSQHINDLIIENSRYLSQLTAEEGTRTSQTYKDYIKEIIDPFHMLGKGADKFRIARALLVGNISEMTEKVNAYVKDIGDAKRDKKAIYEYLTTRGAQPDRIGDAKARRASVEVKSLINEIGDELVRQNLLSQTERNRFIDSYLPRVYMAYIDKQHVRGGIKPSYQYYLEHRQDLTDEQRARLGEIDDPAFLVQEALFAPLRDLAILNFFKKINDIGNGQWILGMDQIKYTNPAGHTYQKSLPDLKMFKHRLERMVSDGSVDPSKMQTVSDELAHLTSFINNVEQQLDANVDKGRYIKVANDTKRFGPLAGVWLARPIYRDIMGMGSFVPNDMSEVAKIFSDGGLMAKATRRFKAAKVAMNPPTIVTNVISNTLMMHFADVPMAMIFPRVASVFKEIVLDKRGRYYDLVHKYGLKETTLSENELHSLYDELKSNKVTSSGLGGVMGLFNALGRSYMNVEAKASNFYGSIETIFKAAVIKDAIERQGLSEEQAVLKANKYLFDYSEVHDSVKALRNVPFGAPFLTWSYKMTPLLIETLLTKPWKFAPYAALFAAVSMYASAAMTDAGGDPEDKDKIKKFISTKAAENPMLLAYSPTDAFDFGKYMPFNNIYKFGNALTKGDIVEAFKAFGFFGGPIADLGVALLSKKDPFTGQDIFPKGATYDEKVALSFNYMVNTFSPSFMKDLPRLIAGHGIDSPELLAGAESPVVNLLKNIFEDPMGKKPGMPVKSYGEIFANIAGFNIYHPSFTQYAMNINKFNREIDDIKAGRRAALQDPTLSKAEIESINKKYQKMLEEKSKELRDFVKDSKVSPQVLEIIRQSVEGKK